MLFERIGIPCRYIIDANEVERKKKIIAVRNKIEDLMQIARTSKEGMNFLVSSVFNIAASLGQIVLSTLQDRQQEYEGFIGCKIPDHIQIHPPTDIHIKGRNTRIKRAKFFLAKPLK
jgi:hypothetical protein